MISNQPLSDPKKIGLQILQLALALAKSVVFLYLTIYIFRPLVTAFGQKLPNEFCHYVAYLLCSLAFLWLVGRIIEKRSLNDYGLGAKSFWAGLKEYLCGSLIGAAMVTTVTLILALMGFYKVTAINPESQILLWIPSLLVAALFEEVLFRGYVLQTIERASNTKIAVILSSLLFGAVHLTNFHNDEPLLTQLASCASLGIDAGLLFAAGYLLTRRLWLAAGLHAFWNIFEGPVYGTPVSGLNIKEPLLVSTLNGPSYLTGGMFGPEASIIEVTVCLFLAWMIWQKSKSTS
ncbi:MAG: CPBP family intramembrane glutamic endopeptidase [Candidatus Obscuribacterales bacterium]